MNAKPATDTPIGYFGTGLKYAVAVLMRHNIPVTIWIDGKKWTVEKVGTDFRAKKFEQLYLMRHSMIKKKINLPFTTELGKNWEIWQAFRELESNTRDEKGETFTTIGDNTFENERFTHIVVQDERYLQAYFDRHKIFLPDGLTVQSSTEALQVFARKSDYIYYRGINIHKLKETSNNTYNFLCHVELTEDRTAKHPYVLEMGIERYIANDSKDPEIIKRAVTAQPRTYEYGLGYDYTSRGDTFLDIVKEAGNQATSHAKAILSKDRPIPSGDMRYPNWYRKLIAAISEGAWEVVTSIIDTHREQTAQAIARAAEEYEKEHANNNPNAPAFGDMIVPSNQHKGSYDHDDDIPF